MSDQEKKGQNPEDDLTRRQWLMRLGEAAVLAGFSGVAGEFPSTATEQSPSPLEKLPPGLYQPMSDHLSHALLNDERLHPIPPGSPTDYVRPLTGLYRPEFFSPREFETVGRLVELLLGESPQAHETTVGAKTDEPVTRELAQWMDGVLSQAAGVRKAARSLRPEHRALAVRYYGSAAVEKRENDEAEKVCREGLAWLEAESTRRRGKPFLSLGESDQVELLTVIADERMDLPKNHVGVRFFRWIKATVVQGFYTSKPGLKELDYKGNSFYVECPGCTGEDYSS